MNEAGIGSKGLPWLSNSLGPGATNPPEAMKPVDGVGFAVFTGFGTAPTGRRQSTICLPSTGRMCPPKRAAIFTTGVHGGVLAFLFSHRSPWPLPLSGPVLMRETRPYGQREWTQTRYTGCYRLYARLSLTRGMGSLVSFRKTEVSRTSWFLPLQRLGISR